MDHKKKTSGKTETAGKTAKATGKTAKKDELCNADPLGLTHCECKKCKAKQKAAKSSKKIELAPGVSLEVSEEKKDRVVLALSTEDADKLATVLTQAPIEKEFASRIGNRILKTLANQKAKREAK